ncbi:MAG: DUF1801 domain-containing protein [Flavobacteriales bacterium]|nr:DUF1801 domain-containing protein [Flavobacteriales bacterium]
MPPEVEAYYYGLPEKQRNIALILRNLILESSPAIEEKLRYKIPFYDYFGMCFFINVRKNIVEIGFAHGHALQDEDQLLCSDHLKQVRHYRVESTEDIQPQPLQALIQQALAYSSLTKKKKHVHRYH